MNDFLDDDFPYEGFSDAEAARVIERFVCPICTGQLASWPIPNSSRNIVACPEHGNVEKIGRISNATVGILEEQSRRRFTPAINNLKEYWGELIPAKRTLEQNIQSLGF